MALVALTTYAMAQVEMGYAYESGKSQTRKADISATKATPVWQVTFEESPAVWTVGNVTGTKAWAVSDTTPTNGFSSTSYGGPVPPLWIYMGWQYVHDYSESGNNFAWVDGISDLLGLLPAEICDTYIQFDGIDLSAVSNPKLTFYQNYKALNAAAAYVDFSVNGGSTWTSVEINTEVEGNAFGANFFELVATSYIANQANVSIRLRWQTTTAAIGGYGYGWEVDDVTITDNPDYDLKFVHAKMNFFEYVDYTVSGQADYYHISSHYGNIPQIQYDSPDALSWFNVALENLGNLTVTPDVKVQVFNPEMTEIFNYTVTGTAMATAAKDTVDLIETDFALGASPALGKYTVAYTLIVPGQVDANLNNNTDTTYFIVTENYFGHDIDKTSAYTGPGSWLDGNMDGEMFGTDFTFLFEDQITSMDVFINENSTVGTSIIGHVLQYDAGTSEWVDISTSPLMEITAESLGNWMNISFTDQVDVLFESGETSKSIRAAIEFYYGSTDNDIWIGYDPTVPVSFWGTSWKLLAGTNANTWVSISNWSRGGLNVHLNLNNYTITNTGKPVSSNIISIYPNPTLGTLNIENVEGCNVQVINMMGQVVENIERANMVNTLDMSKLANGTYFVKVINGNEVSTHKVNLMK